MSPYNDFESRLAKHPELYARFAEILNIAEAPPGHLDRADDAEESIVASLRQLGREILTDWAQHQEQHLRTQHDQRSDVRPDKKNAVGIAASATSCSWNSAIGKKAGTNDHALFVRRVG